VGVKLDIAHYGKKRLREHEKRMLRRILGMRK
jgi:hypothetical protein